MTTKVTIKREIPAGILKGIEIFTHEGKIFGIENGVTKAFNQLPSPVQQTYSQECVKDRAYHKFAKEKWGSTVFSDVFFHWMDCSFGSLDGTPDFDEKSQTTVKDENSWCGNVRCPQAGKTCTLPYGLKIFQVETISLVKRGNTAKQIAAMLHLSKDAVISRIEKSKIRLGATNTPELVAKTTLIK